ncbi:MAG: non-reducing end alpha-L-arabinofuranosidase family hydrolase [Planctomycetota bacterium]
MMTRFGWIPGLVLMGLALPTLAGARAQQNGAAGPLPTEFSWVLNSPVLTPAHPPDDERFSVKDPTIVEFDGDWHLFYTVRSKKRSHQIEYVTFEQWEDANTVERHVLNLSDGYYCAPQVFYFTPHRHWYLICQIIDQSRKPALQPAYSRTTDITDPNSWTKPVLLFTNNPDNVKMWIDFWVICDDARAYLFFTSLNGKMWRSQTKLGDFPHSWTEPTLVLTGQIFEASHTYSLKGSDKYLTIIEAEAEAVPGVGRRRYYKAYTANSLDGFWHALTATAKKPFASPVNVRHVGDHWTDSFSHGELIRSGYDQRLEVDPARLRLLFQGVTDERRRGKKYGEIAWNLGILEPAE